MKSTISVKRDRRGSCIQATGKAAQLLFDKMTALDDGGMPKGTVYTTVEFEDHGQDFLRWDIDESTGLVFASHPFQGFAWRGCEVNMKALAVGEQLFYRREDGRIWSVKYPIVSIVSGRIV